MAGVFFDYFCGAFVWSATQVMLGLRWVVVFASCWLFCFTVFNVIGRVLRS